MLLDDKTEIASSWKILTGSRCAAGYPVITTRHLGPTKNYQNRLLKILSDDTNSRVL